MCSEALIRRIAGVFVMVSLALGTWVHPAWLLFTAFVGLAYGVMVWKAGDLPTADQSGAAALIHDVFHNGLERTIYVAVRKGSAESPGISAVLEALRAASAS